MRIVSLHPAATEIVFALGLGDELVGVTAYCDEPPEARERLLVARRERRRAGDLPGPPLLQLDPAVLEDADPDLVIVSDTSRVCVQGTREVRELVDAIDPEIAVLSLDPMSVDGVLNAIQTVGAMTEAEDEAIDVVLTLRERLQAIEAVVVGRRDHGFVAPRIAALEWLEPPVSVGRWIPEQARLAGGWELLGVEGGRGAVTTWDAIREVDPEILVLMPAGLSLPKTLTAWGALPRPDGWTELTAVRDGRVFAVDGSSYFSRPGPRIIDGIEVLAEIVDPKAFDGMAPNDSFVRVG
ncbi:MAG TPA: ABC transporter substrate-binding protein [Candidatus Limnocylindrales bacterium]